MLVRSLDAGDIERLNRDLPTWSSLQYGRRLAARARGELVQLVAWVGDRAVARGMVLFPGHEEYSVSATREGCAEVRDVFVAHEYRRAGVASAVMVGLEASARDAGMDRIGLGVSVHDDAAPARALYERLGYRHAHGPFLTSSSLEGDDGPIRVGAILTYLVRDL